MSVLPSVHFRLELNFSMRVFIIVGWFLLGIRSNKIKELHAKLRNDYDDIHIPVRDQKLQQDIPSNWNGKSRATLILNKASKTPSSNDLTPINITVDLDWTLEVETASGSWIGLFWFGISWYDYRLSWNKTDFNVSKITVPGSQIWVPDFRDVGMAEGDTKDDIRKQVFIAHHDGLVVGQVKRKHKNYCIVQPLYYPYEMGQKVSVSIYSMKSNFVRLIFLRKKYRFVNSSFLNRSTLNKIDIFAFSI